MANLEKIKDKLSSELENALNDSKLIDMLKKYGLENVVTIQLEVDNSKIKSSQNLNMDIQIKNELEAMSEDKFVMINACPGLNGGRCRWCFPCGSCPPC